MLCWFDAAFNRLEMLDFRLLDVNDRSGGWWLRGRTSFGNCCRIFGEDTASFIQFQPLLEIIDDVFFVEKYSR